MALEKKHSSPTMKFGTHRDIDKIVPSQTMPSASGKQKRVNVNFDEDKHTRFKAACAKKGISITDVLSSLVDDWLKENE